ncbi:SGNH/GDSL hydrolase family protein [Priestia megaterium]|uniref:SGNH/GDSL hydrolase family protein n=1 Tax=Priestia megaterium TaxID=1404 RepID=UPI000BA574EF|nr:hypothetical protein [Priestia megaterium]PAK50012.1 hypothetical protein CHH47_12650 [Priestia megaterium]
MSRFNSPYNKELNDKIGDLSQNISDRGKEVKSLIVKPLYVETFASMGRYGVGTPSGVANYTGGNFVCTISGNAGDKFVTVKSGTVADGGGIWTAVIQDDNKNCYMNKVLSISGNTFQLIDPLPVSITNGKIGNLHDSPQGLHYTELGYFAFAQHIYKTNPKYTERQINDKQFLGTDSSSFWNLTTSWSSYNNVTNIDNSTDNTIAKYGRAGLVLNLASASHAAELTYDAKEKGYIELFVSSKNVATLDYLKDGVVVKTIEINSILKRITLDFDYSESVKVRIYDVNSSGTAINSLRISNTTIWLNRANLPDKLIDKNDKVVYIGDSWGVYHNKATTRELERLMTADGGTPIVLNYSRAGHSTNYALDGFEEYVLNNKPDKVIIEYYCNDFASIKGADLGTFTAVDSTQKSLNVTSLTQYLKNMKKMIDMAIKNGIQPIIIMASVTDAMNRSQEFSDIISSIWLGETLTKNTVETTNVIAKQIKQAGSTKYGNSLELITTEENASARQGVVMDTDKNITGGSLFTVKNNGTVKYKINPSGRPIIPDTQITPQYGTQTPNSGNRGIFYIFDGQGGTTKVDDELRIVIQKADGTYVTKKIQLID